MLLIDSHAHLTDERFHGDVDAVVQCARAAGVETVVSIGSDVADSRAAADLASRLPGVYATAGIHPHTAGHADAAAFDAIRELAGSPRVVALGETGLDYYYDNAPRDVQRATFAGHLELAHELDLPVVVHGRDADDDLRAMIRESGEGAVGVLHCFAAGRALLETALECGWYISFSGLITFKRYTDADLVRAVPADRILVETDSPYLAPVPHRGKRNEPAHVAHVARRAAEMRGADPEAFAAAAARNARTLYRISE